MQKLTASNNISDTKWDKFISQCDYSGFMQSSGWAKVKESEGWKPLKIAITKNNKIKAAALFLAMKTGKNKVLIYSPQGPALDWQKSDASELLEIITKTLKTQLQKGNQYTLRIEPWSLYFNDQHLPKCFVKSKIDMQPRNTAVIATNKDLPEIMSFFKQKTRYNINLAEKKVVQIELGQSARHYKNFFDIYKKTVDRKKIDFKDMSYFQSIRKYFKNAYVINAKVDGKYVGTLFLIHFGNRLTYFFGGFDYEYRRYMAPYLCHKSAIVLAKDLKCDFYDLWGIANTDDPNHPWQSFTKFKMGFNPVKITLIGSRDYVFEY